MLRIIIHGCRGRLGREIAKVATSPNSKVEVEIVAGIDMEIAEDNLFTFPVFESLDKCNVKADMVIDASTAAAVDALLDYCALENTALVLCTTGLRQSTLDKLQSVSTVVPIFKSYNMSVGVNFISSFLKKISGQLYDLDFDIEIVDKHHNLKIDSPSGTVNIFYDSITESLKDVTPVKVYDRHTGHGPRERNEIGIHSIRGGGIVGEHSVIFAADNEIIEIKHSAVSREVFAHGALKAASFLSDKKHGLYEMSDMIDAL